MLSWLFNPLSTWWDGTDRLIVVLAGDAERVLDVVTIRITGYSGSTTYKVTSNGKVVSALGSGGTVNTAAAALQAALAASTVREFAEMTWTVLNDTITGTANETRRFGKTHSFTSSVSGGLGTIGAVTSSASPKGKTALTDENVKRIETGERLLPGHHDLFVLSHLRTDLLYSLDALAAVESIALNVLASFRGKVGLPFFNEDSAPYKEYRSRYLQLKGATLTIGAGDGQGSRRIQVDTLDGLTSILVIKTAQSSDDLHAFIWKGAHASNSLRAESGSIDVAPYPDDTATLATLVATGDAIVRTSRGTTLAAVQVDQQAEVTIDSAAALANISQISVHGTATLNLLGDNGIDELLLNGTAPTANIAATADYTIGICSLYQGATLDLSNSPSSVTITTFNAYGHCRIIDPNGKLLFSGNVARFTSLVDYQGPPSRAITAQNA
jgi:hypothetical protein